MIFLELKGTHFLHQSHNNNLVLKYYLVKSYYEHRPIYGIQIQSYEDGSPLWVHSEGIFHISYSLSYVNQLISQCVKHFVTPTDLFSSIDLLMDKFM